MVGTITSIEDRDFENGWLGDCTRCPVALAMSRKGYANPVVDFHEIAYFDAEGDEIVKPMTVDLKRKIEAIENKKRQVKLFSIIERKNRFSLYKGA